MNYLQNNIIGNYYNHIAGKKFEILNLSRRNYEVIEEINPIIFNFNLHFLKLSEELNNHLKLQEEIIFPAIMDILNAGSCTDILNNLSLRDVIKEANKNQDEIVKELNIIRKQRENILFSGSSASFYKKLYSLTLDFEKAVQFQLHLENSILYPEALFLEEEAKIWE
ncbi:hypothetical protein BH23BAC1_BH23BAC1_28670 [soil metagenome]